MRRPQTVAISEDDEGKRREAAHVDVVGRQPDGGGDGVVVHKPNVRQVHVPVVLLFVDDHGEHLGHMIRARSIVGGGQGAAGGVLDKDPGPAGAPPAVRCWRRGLDSSDRKIVSRSPRRAQYKSRCGRRRQLQDK